MRSLPFPSSDAIFSERMGKSLRTDSAREASFSVTDSHHCSFSTDTSVSFDTDAASDDGGVSVLILRPDCVVRRPEVIILNLQS